MPILEMRANLEALEKISSRLTHFKRQGLPAAHLNAGNAVKGWIDSNFTIQGGLVPGGWAGYKNQTVVNHRLLEKSGRLRQNWHVYATNESVSIKSGVSYALAHHYGTDILPARPLLPQGDTFWELVLPVYARAITDDITG